MINDILSQVESSKSETTIENVKPNMSSTSSSFYTWDTRTNDLILECHNSTEITNKILREEQCNDFALVVVVGTKNY